MNLAEFVDLHQKMSTQPTLPYFPMSCLPANLRDYAFALSGSVQVTPDMVALPMLGVLASVFQRNFTVRINADYTEPLSLYTLTIAKPSERKSAVISALEEPIWDFQTMLNQDLEENQKPKTLYTSDTTPEKLAVTMSENDGICAIISDEPDALATAAGLRYGKVKNLGLMLQSWSNGRVLIQRVKDNRRIVINHARLSIAIMSQPSFAMSLIQDKEVSSRGLIARFLFSRPPSLVGLRHFNAPELSVPEALKDEYYQMIFNFLQTDGQYELTLSPEAEEVADLGFQSVEGQIAEESELEAWMGKIFGQMLRIAGILHCCIWQSEAQDHPIEGETMMGAILIGVYFIRQAQSLFHDAEEEKIPQYLEDAQKLEDAMRRDGSGSWEGHDFSNLVRRLRGDRRKDAVLWLEHEGILKITEEKRGIATVKIYTLTATDETIPYIQ